MCRWQGAGGRGQGPNRLSKNIIYRAVDGLVSSRYAQAALVFAVSLLVYSGSIYNGFVYDDWELIVANLWIRDYRYIPEIFTSHIWSFMGEGSSNYYRPLMTLFYMADYYIFGLEPWGFHLSFVLAHGLVSLAAFFLFRLLLASRLPASRLPASPLPASIEEPDPGLAPLAAALIFATHPIHTQVVAWNGIHEMSLTLFSILSLLFHIRGRTTAAITCFFIAALSKETAAAVPIIIFAYDWCNGRIEVSLTKRCATDLLKRYLPFVVVGLLYMAIRNYGLGGFVTTPHHGDLSLFEWFINVFPLFGKYLLKLTIPLGLNAAHTFHPARSLFEAPVLLGFASAGLFLLALYFSGKRHPIVFLSLTVIAVPLVPAMYIPALSTHVFAENYLYLPSVGFSILLTLAVFRYAPSSPRNICAAATAVLIVCYSAVTVWRVPVWKSDLTLWTDTVKKSPDSYVARNNLGLVYFKASRIEEALREYMEALKINPANANTHNNMGVLYYETGRFEAAAKKYEDALFIDPAFTNAMNNLGVVYVELGRVEEGVEKYKEALSLRPAYPDALSNLGVAYVKLGRVEEGFKKFKEALEVDAEYAAAYNNIGAIYFRQGRYSDAAKEYAEALRVEPSYGKARENLEATLRILGEGER